MNSVLNRHGLKFGQILSSNFFGHPSHSGNLLPLVLIRRCEPSILAHIGKPKYMIMMYVTSLHVVRNG